MKFPVFSHLISQFIIMIISYLIICFNTLIIKCTDIPSTDFNTKIKENFVLLVFTQFIYSLDF